MARQRSVDLEGIKAEYITTDISQRQLARKYGISASTISRRAAEEHWCDLRADYERNMTAKAVQKAEARASTARANSIVSLQQSADKMVDVVAQVFEDAEQFHRHVVVEKEGFSQKSVEKRFEKYDTRAMRDVTAMIRDLAAAVRDLHEIPTLIERSAMDIAAERLKLEQRKVANEEHKGEAEDIKIVFEKDENEEFSV